MKREGALKTAFTNELRRQHPEWVSALLLSAGHPDRAIVGNGVTSWWEFKHATPDFDSPGLQELQCMRIAKQGICWYVLWTQDRMGGDKYTKIVSPQEVHDRTWKTMQPHAMWPGHDMQWLVRQVAQVHGIQP